MKKLLRSIIAVAVFFASAALARHGAIPVPTLTSYASAPAAIINMAPWGQTWTSTDFTDGRFTLTQATVSTGFTDPPLSGTTAQKLAETTTSGQHNISASISTQSITTITYRVAVIAKAVERTRIVVFNGNATAANAVSIGYDLAGGNVGYDNSVGASITLVAATMTNLKNGWWLCTFDWKFTSAVSGGGNNTWTPQISLDNGSGTNARSISYSGTAGNGALVWWLNELPLAVWNMTSGIVFQDNFNDLNGIDLNNTKFTGYRWYVNNLFPNSFMTTFGWTTRPPSFPTKNSYITPGPGPSVQLLNPSNNQIGFTSQFWSVVDDGSGGFIGFAPLGPMLFDATMAWDNTNQPNWQGNSAFWGSPVEALTTTPGMGAQTHFTEWDVMESAPPGNGGLANIHDWSVPASPVDRFLTGGGGFTTTGIGNYNRSSGLWLTTAATGTSWGMFMSFSNGTFSVSDKAYNAADVPNPNPNSWPSGTFAAVDAMHMPVFIDTAENTTNNAGGGQQMNIKQIRVYK